MWFVEQAKLSELEDLSALLAILFSQESEFTPNLELQCKGLEMILEEPSMGTIFVLKSEAKIVGMVTLLWSISTALGGKVAWLEDMIVKPAYQHKGGGSLLLSAAITHAKASHCKRITLLTDTDNINAQTFYKRLGFTHSSMSAMRFLMV
ncbi:GNAT family N-acetyltransferase [Sulfurospirillum barnesii]|uniref:Acetyltransferase n=1 Tax=Sulfurospirillum barnesii (strain ATCC 700032 / DSM 10660 / SES-3) TaxID=760154 RepID=I3XV90_SULBS|nr:GNAT family N-acetyltransferase [Sulfurospirillum barnesii]AFL67864.1 acetyltransferase [Sulfurospirillum barnesii SES-3]